MSAPHRLRILQDEKEVAQVAAAYVARRAQAAVASWGSFCFAVSGGQTPWMMFDALAREDVPWSHVTIYQVDERVAPPGDPERNLSHLKWCLADVPARVRAMPVDDRCLDEAALRYESILPERFDLVHLGLGPDGHTASLVPGDPVLEVTDRLVHLTGTYRGRTRMTLTYPALKRATEVLWVVTGEEKRRALAQLLCRDLSVPAGRIDAPRSLIMADKDAQ